MKKFLLSLLLMSQVWPFLNGCARYNGLDSDHYDGKRFFNPGKPLDKSFGSFLKWKLTADKREWPDYTDLVSSDHPPLRVVGDQLRVSFVGHATVRLDIPSLLRLWNY